MQSRIYKQLMQLFFVIVLHQLMQDEKKRKSGQKPQKAGRKTGKSKPEQISKTVDSTEI